MREIGSWRASLVRRLRQQWPSPAPAGCTPALLCDVELGLALLEQLAPGLPAHALWSLLTGYPFATPEQEGWTPDQLRRLGNGRHLLQAYRSEYAWRRALERYRRVELRLCRYEVGGGDGRFARREVTVCADRGEVYGIALDQAPRHRTAQLRWAAPGEYQFVERRHLASVDIPPELTLPPPSGHPLAGVLRRSAITVSWADLVATARWMDAETAARGLKSAAWEKRLGAIRLEEVREDSEADAALVRAQRLTLDGLTHLIGMVSSGKSTLMDVLAVWAARNGLRVTLVVGDVVNALERADQFLALGLAAAPILGASNRAQHANRLHRALADEQPYGARQPCHSGFMWLSTGCPLDGLRDAARPLRLGAQPCLALQALDDFPENEDVGSRRPPQRDMLACPIYAACPAHQAQRDLVEATIWIATPASMVYTRVARQINREQIRFAELIYRRSDMVIVDEADRVQVQLDMMFSPNQTLVSRRGDA